MTRSRLAWPPIGARMSAVLHDYVVDTHWSYVQRLKFDTAAGKAITIESATVGHA
jgi:hypothetical protein